MLNNINVVVKEKGLKNTWIAEQLGVNACDISHWCSGHRKPSQEKLKALAKVCCVKVRDLYPNARRTTIFEI